MTPSKKQKPSPFRLTGGTVNKNMYIDKMHMLELIKEYQSSIAQAKENNEPDPIMGNELGGIILELATNLTKRYNFRNYSYTDMFISDSVLLGLHLAKTFDVNHPSANAYSYFSFSFFRTMAGIITREKNLLEGKYKYIAQLDLDTSAYQDHDDGHNNQYIEFLKEQVDTARSFYEKVDQKVDDVEEPIVAKNKPTKISRFASLEF